MKAEVIAIGSELLLGQIVDTNSAYLAKTLAENGIELVRTSTVGDDFERIEAIIKEAMARSSIIITTGGLGPTEDDLTREVIAQATHRPLVLHQHLLAQLEAHYQRRGFRMTENNLKQATIPEGAIPVENPKGTAAAFIVEGPSYITVSLPGVPLEMKYLMEHSIIPYLRKRFNLRQEIIRYKVLRTTGLGESGVGLQIGDLMRESKNPSVGTLVSPGDVRIRITAQADDSRKVSELIEQMEKEIRNRLGPLIYGVDDDTLQGNIVKELNRTGLTLAVVETYTGGIILEKLTWVGDNPIVQGIVLPSEMSQKMFLGGDERNFSSSVKDPTGLTDSLARRASQFFGTTVGLAQWARIVEKSEREIQIQAICSLSSPEGPVQEEHLLGGDPTPLRERVAILALNLLRKYLLKGEEKDARSH